jgi:hypothetical protein
MRTIVETMRLVMAVVMAAWMPLCCCQVGALAGSDCCGVERVVAPGPVGDGCCESELVEGSEVVSGCHQGAGGPEGCAECRGTERRGAVVGGWTWTVPGDAIGTAAAAWAQPCDEVTPSRVVGGGEVLIGGAGRPSSSLVRMHCALTV